MRLIKAALLAVFYVFALEPAQATILFAGGEDVDGTLVGTATVDTTSSNFRSGYGRADIKVPGASVADPPTQRFTLPSFANQSTIWVHAENIESTTTTATGVQALGVFGSDGVRRILVRQTATVGQVKISTRNTAGTITDLVTCNSGAWPITSLNKIDLFLNYAVSGEVTLYENGASICDFTGDVTTNSVTAVNQVDIGEATQVTGNTFWSEIIIATTDTRSMNLLTCAPASNGTNMAWSGSFSNVNPTSINDASVISSSTNNQVAEFNGPSLPSGSFTVPAVTQAVRLVLGASGPQHFRYIARPSSGSTDYDNGSDVSATTAFANYVNIWATNPATSTAWTTGDLSTCGQFGVKSISMLLGPDNVVPFVLRPRLLHLLRLAA